MTGGARGRMYTTKSGLALYKPGEDAVIWYFVHYTTTRTRGAFLMPKRSLSPVTMNQIAAHCGLSKATISRALNSPEKLRPDTLRVVREAFQELGYHYNPLAASLTKSSSGIVGVIIGNIRENSYVITLADIQKFASQHQLNVMFSISDYSGEKERDILQTFRQYKTAMVIVIGPGVHCHDHIAEVLGDAIPHLILWETYEDKNLNFVGTDPAALMDGAVGYLRSLGHERVGLGMSMSCYPSRATARIAAFRRALAENGMDAYPDSVVILDDTRPPHSALVWGKSIMTDFLERKERPTAVVFTTGGMAEGGVMGLYEHGISFPEAMSVMSLADDDVAEHFFPPLTALDSRIGTVLNLARRFIAQVANGERPRIQRSLGTRLIKRASCMPHS